MKKIIPLITAVMLVSQPFSSYAENEQIFSETINGSTFYYTVDSSMNAVITDCSSCEEEIKIPSSLGGYMVKSIGDKAFFGKIMLTSIDIPEGITYIGENAFSGCLSLESIKLPETLTYLGNGCFTSCTALENVLLNDSLSSVPDNCFNACTSLNSINIPESVVFIGMDAFFGCSDISGIFIPPTVEIIGENAFGMHYDIRNNGIEKINNFRIKGFPATSAETYAINTGIELYCKLGDVNDDGFIDAVDSSAVLIEYSNLSTGSESSFDTYQQYVGDYNRDGLIDAVDATLILIEYARLQTLPDNQI
ncbi:MAG: leucine-rich repeat protein [Ruminococcus flavefaciens]|nr:leucine-rich repeat protein [Ruminococcus flavefaciens]